MTKKLSVSLCVFRAPIINVEDLQVIQAIQRNGKMYFRTKCSGTIGTTSTNSSVQVAAVARNDIFFTGPEMIHSFFKCSIAVIGRNCSRFSAARTDTFAGTNLSTVIEVPKTMLGGSGTLKTG
jgi:hypothetical protein